MKCPKCGYNSFEFLDSCKKCSNDLTSFKQSHGIRAIVIPFPGPSATATAVPAAAVGIAAVAAVAAAAPAAAEESFSWEPPTPVAQIKPGDDIFPDLDLRFAAPPAAEPAPEPFSFDLEQTTTAASAPVSVPDEPELADFSFDEPAGATPSPFDAAPAEEDGFASLLETGDSSEETAAAPAVAPASELESPWESPANAFGGLDEAVAPAVTVAQSSNDDFDLESFSWGEERKKEPSPQPGPQVELNTFSTDEFDSLFGESEDSQKK
ncbi:MAG: hypothetical protein ED859_02560 [Desulfuromonadales bacterium]|nr:MAG: hypothetical protein ED859_02560 [Desulfuromonadales bacterium]